jgi:uncharacterized membrane protein YeaQ/YmgE (transglycosylase-associated protein family)
MALLAFLVFGLVIGLVARALLPGQQPMGILMTMALGIAGSFLGGVIVSLATGHPLDQLHTSGFIGSVIGALLVLLIVGGMRNRRVA